MGAAASQVSQNSNRPVEPRQLFSVCGCGKTAHRQNDGSANSSGHFPEPHANEYPCADSPSNFLRGQQVSTNIAFTTKVPREHNEIFQFLEDLLLGAESRLAMQMAQMTQLVTQHSERMEELLSTPARDTRCPSKGPLRRTAQGYGIPRTTIVGRPSSSGCPSYKSEYEPFDPDSHASEAQQSIPETSQENLVADEIAPSPTQQQKTAFCKAAIHFITGKSKPLGSEETFDGASTQKSMRTMREKFATHQLADDMTPGELDTSLQRLQRFAYSSAFNFCSLFIAVLYFFFVGFQTSIMMQWEAKRFRQDVWFDFHITRDEVDVLKTVDRIFCLALVLELLIRMLAAGRNSLYARDRLWNLVDLVIVLSWII